MTSRNVLARELPCGCLYSISKSSSPMIPTIYTALRICKRVQVEMAQYDEPEDKQEILIDHIEDMRAHV